MFYYFQIFPLLLLFKDDLVYQFFSSKYKFTFVQLISLKWTPKVFEEFQTILVFTWGILLFPYNDQVSLKKTKIQEILIQVLSTNSIIMYCMGENYISLLTGLKPCFSAG